MPNGNEIVNPCILCDAFALKNEFIATPNSEHKYTNYRKRRERWRKIYATRDNTYKNLKRIINDPNIAVVPGDKELCVVIMNRSDYFKILQHMIDKSIENGVYIVTEDKKLEDLKLFRSFLYRNFK